MTQGSQSKTFCTLPWNHLATYTDGGTGLCCIAKTPRMDDTNVNTVSPKDIINHPHWKGVRKKIMAGEEVNDCRKCYEEEHNGYKSHRIIENGVWVDRIGQDGVDALVAATEADGTVSNDIMALDLRLGNTCNLQCVMCAPTESSKWLSASKRFIPELDLLQTEWEQKSDIQASRHEWYKNDSFWDDVYTMLPNLHEIILAGGEPLLIEQQYKIIEEAVRTGDAEHIILRYHTNGTIMDENLLGVLDKFKKVEFFVSIDSVEDKNHWIRYPSDWDTIVKNLHILDNTPDNVEVWILNSLQALNMFYITEFMEFIIEQKFKKVARRTKGMFHPGIVHYPSYLNPKVLPNDLKQYITNLTKVAEEHYGPTDKLDGVINFMNSEDWTDHLPKLREYIIALDKTRGTDFKKTFPEIAGYIFD